MINKYNIAELSLVDRPIGGTQTGFGSVINRFPSTHDQRSFNTTQGDVHGATTLKSATQTVTDFKAEYNKQAGGNGRPIDLQKVRTVSCLTGENLSKKDGDKRDPQEHTDVQRSWLYSKDAAVAAVRQQPEVQVSQILPYDNALSLPLGDGIWSQKPKSDAPAFFRRIRTDVTIQKNNIITRK